INVIQQSLDDFFHYSGAADFDPTAFRGFVDTFPEQSVARDYINKMEELIDQIYLLGLTQFEYGNSKEHILGDKFYGLTYNEQSIEIDQLEAFIIK
ncbi:hypothetical protein ACFL02_04130, partial [Planctomycetota bacterium]